MDGIHVAAYMTISKDSSTSAPHYFNPYSLCSLPSVAQNVTKEGSVHPSPPVPLADISKGSGSLELVTLFGSCLRSDRADKLYTTVVCDEHGVCLGLVYSSMESLRVAVTERRGVYWSRSRNSLWRKGDSSGMFQELLNIKVDCDFDAVRFTVYQCGDPPAFCHLMTRTCWGHVNGVKKLETILLDRKKSAPEGSYTKRLFDDPDLLRKKLLEEVRGLCIITFMVYIYNSATKLNFA